MKLNLKLRDFVFSTYQKATPFIIDCINAIPNVPIKNPLRILNEFLHEWAPPSSSVPSSLHLSVSIITIPILNTTAKSATCKKKWMEKFGITRSTTMIV